MIGLTAKAATFVASNESQSQASSVVARYIAIWGRVSERARSEP
jgi:hypothetical protein